MGRMLLVTHLPANKIKDKLEAKILYWAAEKINLIIQWVQTWKLCIYFYEEAPAQILGTDVQPKTRHKHNFW